MQKIMLLLLILPLRLYPQPAESHFVFSHILKTGTQQEKSISTIFQDSRGFLWLGTSKGLCRYDGSAFKYYNTLGKEGITDWLVTCITEDRKGNIWFGTENGLNKLHPLTGKITNYYSGTGAGKIPFNWCNQLYVDSKKNLWLSTEKGIALYDEASDSFTNFPVAVFDKDELINKFIRNIVEDKEGALWLGTSFGVKRFNPSDGSIISYHIPGNGQMVSGNVTFSLFIDHSNTIWAGSFTGDLLRFNKTKGQFEKTATLQTKSGAVTIHNIKEIRSGIEHYLLLATDNGLYYILNNGSNPVPRFSSQPSTRYLKYIFTDRQQNVWAGGTDGLFKMNKNSFAFRWIKAGGGDNEPIFHIIPAVSDSAAFYLTTVKGWWKYRMTSHVIEKENIPVTKNKLLEYINDWQTDENGYWFSSVNGFGYYNVRNNTVTDLTHIVTKYSGRPGTGYILTVAPGVYWISMRRSGILEYNSVTGKHRQLFGDKDNPDHVYSQDISDMKIHPGGLVYFIAGKKLYSVDPQTLHAKTYNQPAGSDDMLLTKAQLQRLCVTPENKILVITPLKVYLLENEQLKPLFPAEGYARQSIQKVVAGKNDFWFFSGTQVYKTDSRLNQWQDVKQLLGWADTTDIIDLYAGMNDHTLFAAKGYAGVLLNKALAPVEKPEKMIASYIKNGSTVTFLPASGNAIRASFKDAIEIELSPLDFSGGNRHYYQLQGWDNEWKEMISSTVIRYEQLPPGHYTFRSKAVNASGITGEEAVIKINVIPPFYRTWWFIAGILTLASGSAYLLYRYRLKKALELERLRTRIATDLHDDIGATLSSISMYSESLKNQVKEKLPHLEPVLTKMGENSREMVTGMSDIVWAINPGNDTGEKLLQRMENYATDICAAKNIRLIFSGDERIKQLQLPLEQRRNIYLIFKEAVNNAVKYSQAANLWVEIGEKNWSIHLSVKDDGTGFDPTTIVRGNGLTNMTLRAEEMKALINIISDVQTGTRIDLMVKY